MANQQPTYHAYTVVKARRPRRFLARDRRRVHAPGRRRLQHRAAGAPDQRQDRASPARGDDQTEPTQAAHGCRQPITKNKSRLSTPVAAPPLRREQTTRAASLPQLAARFSAFGCWRPREIKARRGTSPQTSPPTSACRGRRTSSSHSITSSAMESTFGGTSMPSARAVCRLMTNSNLVDCTTGMSAGLAPLRIGRYRRRLDETCPRGWFRSSSGLRPRQDHG